MIVVLVFALILGVLGLVHWYLWRRIVRDTTAPGSLGRRVGTVMAFALPLTTLGSQLSGRLGAPFAVEQVLAWPGYLWLAVVLYLTLALLAGEAVRPVLLRLLAARDARRAGAAPAPNPPAASGTTRDETARDGTTRDGTAQDGATPATAAVRGGATVPEESATSHSAAGPSATATATARTASGTGTGTGPGTPHGEPGGDAGHAGPSTPTEGPAPATPGPGADRPAGPSRRLFVARTVAVAASAVALGTVGNGARGVLDGPAVKRVTVPLAKLPRAAHGYRIAVVSDVHLGPVLGRAHARRVVETVNRTQPDLVAIVGDLVDGDVADLGPAAEPLADLRARDGSFFVTGNHEYFSGAGQWVDHVRELGVRPLENERVELPGFDLAGVNDLAAETEPGAQGPDFGRALGDRDTARASVLLAHQPVLIDEAVRHGVDLQLSGHTHGGQLWPGEYLAALANPTVAGLERYGDTQLYVSRGAGAWGPPVRVGAESDITVVTLASRDA
ncbi:metallophosphoesterase [Streptomyces zingiberis]|uniref:Metallophosphoesterase n=1 Tax=Streptomyces zingiberis TaxID=2053010 RepID=A0ABX1BWJ8_9ACTN|nr:metallophosphoesterase [Streptomyces zingiberis]NJQ00663.1 metallophosphoesterase [Streptomyces zingiberis]